MKSKIWSHSLNNTVKQTEKHETGSVNAVDMSRHLNVESVVNKGGKHGK